MGHKGQWLLEVLVGGQVQSQPSLTETDRANPLLIEEKTWDWAGVSLGDCSYALHPQQGPFKKAGS